MPKQRKEEEEVIYHSDTTSVVLQPTEFNVCVSWQEPLEELSNKEINPYVGDFQFEIRPR
ncbi:hypothetical protein M1N13_03550 [Dehalococcoidia bacterium]|nr:hypothetical protein [Dehalococcoidia bacterium]